jgi:hypothetical protein
MSDHALTIVAWIAIAAMFAGLEIVALSSRRRLAGIGGALRSIGGAPVGRLVLALAWMWLGWHVFAR